MLKSIMLDDGFTFASREMGISCEQEQVSLTIDTNPPRECKRLG